MGLTSIDQQMVGHGVEESPEDELIELLSCHRSASQLNDVKYIDVFNSAIIDSIIFL